MYSMLSTSHISALVYVAIVDYSCTPCCPLNTYQHLCMLLLWTTHVLHVVHYTHISTCVCCYCGLLMYSMLSTSHISALVYVAIDYSCTPCCPLHTYQHLCMLLLTTHVLHVVHFTHISTCYVAIVDYSCTPCCPLHTYQHLCMLLLWTTHVLHVVHY